MLVASSSAAAALGGPRDAAAACSSSAAGLEQRCTPAVPGPEQVILEREGRRRRREGIEQGVGAAGEERHFDKTGSRKSIVDLCRRFDCSRNALSARERALRHSENVDKEREREQEEEEGLARHRIEGVVGGVGRTHRRRGRRVDEK